MKGGELSEFRDKIGWGERRKRGEWGETPTRAAFATGRTPSLSFL